MIREAFDIYANVTTDMRMASRDGRSVLGIFGFQPASGCMEGVCITVDKARRHTSEFWVDAKSSGL